MKKQLLSILFLVTLSTATWAQVPNYVPTNGLAGWWPFNGNANDESGNGNDRVNYGAVLTSDRNGNTNSAFLFSGINNTNSYLGGATNSALDFTEFTVSCWVMPNSLGDEMGEIAGSYANPRGYFVGSINGYPHMRIHDGVLSSVSSVSLSTQEQIESGAWSHLAFSFDGNNMRIFVNGIIDNSVDVGNFIFVNQSRLLIGTATWFPGNGIYDGKIDDIGIWNRALTPCEIQQLYIAQTIAPPTATITPQGSTTFCTGGSVTLTASQGTSYQWSSGQTSQSITVSQEGYYTVTVTDVSGCEATSEAVTVTVNETPSAVVTASGANTFCSGGSVTLTAQGTGSYQWSNGATSQSIDVTQGGDYSVTVTSNGCSATSGVTTVTVNPTPTATITPQGSTTFCEGGFVVLQASGGSTYQWNTGAQTSSVNVSQGGSYSVIVTVNGCSATSESVSVTVNPLPTVSLASIAPLCENSSAMTLGGGSPAGGTYTVNGAPATTLNPAQTGSGTHTVVYSYTDGNGCMNTATQNATIHTVPSVSISGLNTTYLPTDAPVQLTGTPSGGVFNGTGVSNGEFDPATAGLGTHGIAYIVVDANGCAGSQALCTTVDITTGEGIGTDNGGNGVEVYPNPGNGLYTVVLDGMDGIVNLSVVDMRGREVAAQTLTARGRTTHSIDLSGLASGVYSLRVQSTLGTGGIKLVKE